MPCLSRRALIAAVGGSWLVHVSAYAQAQVPEHDQGREPDQAEVASVIWDVDGQFVEARISAAAGLADVTTGPIAVEITTATGIDPVVARYIGDFGAGWAVKVVDAALPVGVAVQIAVRVPAAAALPINVRLYDGAGDRLARADGATNGWVVAEAME